MAVAQNRLSYISDNRSDQWISQQTGIPRSTIGFVRRGERPLPSQYDGVLRNTYQREAYGRLRNEGFSYHQARRFSSYAPQSASLKESNMKLLVNDLTLGAIASKLKKEGLAVNEENVLSKWDETRKEIVESLQKSHKDWETVERYIG